MRLARLHYEPPAKGEPKLVTAPSLHSKDLHLFLELPDHLGSESLTIDYETGELVEARTYQPYGATESDYRPDRWKGFREDYGFTGKEEDIEVGLQYFGKRYLSPYLGRWISADPLAVHAPGQADPNLYAYVHGALLRNVDPIGLADDPRLQAVTESYTAAKNAHEARLGAEQAVLGDLTTKFLNYTKPLVGKELSTGQRARVNDLLDSIQQVSAIIEKENFQWGAVEGAFTSLMSAYRSTLDNVPDPLRPGKFTGKEAPGWVFDSIAQSQRWQSYAAGVEAASESGVFAIQAVAGIAGYSLGAGRAPDTQNIARLFENAREMQNIASSLIVGVAGIQKFSRSGGIPVRSGVAGRGSSDIQPIYDGADNYAEATKDPSIPRPEQTRGEGKQEGKFPFYSLYKGCSEAAAYRPRTHLLVPVPPMLR